MNEIITKFKNKFLCGVCNANVEQDIYLKPQEYRDDWQDYYIKIHFWRSAHLRCEVCRDWIYPNDEFNADIDMNNRKITRVHKNCK
jgi:hypothetical protein